MKFSSPRTQIHSAGDQPRVDHTITPENAGQELQPESSPDYAAAHSYPGLMGAEDPTDDDGSDDKKVQELAGKTQALTSSLSDDRNKLSSPEPDDQANECRVTRIDGRTSEMTNEQYDNLIHEELENIWILNLSMHFRNESKREKFFVTYIKSPSQWKRVTLSLDYGNAPVNSLEADLSSTKFQRDKSAKIYEAIRYSLADIQFYDTVTNLKLSTREGRLHVDVVEDVTEIIDYPTPDIVRDIPCSHITEGDIKFESHISGFIYKVSVHDQVLTRKDIPSPGRVGEYLKQIRTLGQLLDCRFVIDLYGVVLSQNGTRITGYLMPFCPGGALVDVIYDNPGGLSWSRREKWAKQIVTGLSQIHDIGTVHGNLTLSSIVLDDDDDIRILGIGTDRVAIGWEPPEVEPVIQANQSVTRYLSLRSDIFQLGMVLWALANQNDEPETLGRPLPVIDDMGVPAWYKLVVEACLSRDPQQRPHAASLLDFFPSIIYLDIADIRNNPALEASSDGSSVGTSSVIDEDDEDDLFATASVASIATSVSTGSTYAASVKDATISFADLLDDSMDLTGHIQTALEQKRLNPDALRNGIRRLLKLLSRDLSLELSVSEYRDVCNFFMSFSRQISSEIVSRAGVKVVDSDPEKKTPEDAETGASRVRRVREKIIEVFDDDSDAEGETPVPAPWPQIYALREAVASSDAFQLFLSSLNTLIHPTFESRLKRVGQVATERASEIDPDGSLARVVAELLYSQPLTITLSNTDATSWVDTAKAWIEKYTQQEWEWWPLRPPQVRVGEGKARLRWRCLCGEMRSAILSEGYARYLVKARRETMLSPSSAANQTSPLTGSAAAAAAARTTTGTSQSGGPGSGGLSQSSSAAGRYTPAPRSNIPNTSHQPVTPSPSQDRYVLFVVPSSALRLHEIESKDLCNEGLFQRIRDEYYQTKGWLRAWFGLMVYSHCDFFKFEAWYKGRYCERGSGIPAKDDQGYFYVPKPMDREPPISEHEFSDRFYRRVRFEDCILRGSSRCAERDAVQRIPQKKDLISTAGDTRPQFYGIIAREKKSGLRMLVYIVVSSVPGIVFFFLWLFQWDHDSLQDASFLLMASFTLLGLLYAAQLF